MADASLQAVKKILGKESAPEPAPKQKKEQKSTLGEVKEHLAKLPKKKVEQEHELQGPMLAAVLIRGREIGVRHDMVRTLDKLKLRRRHICVVYPDNAAIRGMMNKCKDLITYGPISAETFQLLHEKRVSLKDSDRKPINVFRMHPPRGGYGHKGIKVSYQEGGCLGLRRKGMDMFLAKMM